MFKKFRNFLKLITERKELTAKAANFKSRFGSNTDDWNDVVSRKVKIIEDQIYNKISYSRKEMLLNLRVPEDQVDLYESVRKHFEDRGFKTFYADRNNIKELGNNKYLFLSWDIKTEDNNK